VSGDQPVVPDSALHAQPPSGRRTVKVLGVGLIAWGLPKSIWIH
jgi:chromate transporter